MPFNNICMYSLDRIETDIALVLIAIMDNVKSIKNSFKKIEVLGLFNFLSILIEINITSSCCIINNLMLNPNIPSPKPNKYSGATNK